MDNARVRLAVLAATALVLGVVLLAIIASSGVPRPRGERDDGSRRQGAAAPAQGNVPSTGPVVRDALSGEDLVRDLILVQAPGGQRVGGVRVWIRSGDHVQEGLTEDDGGMRVGLPVGLVELEASHEGFGTRSLAVATTAGADEVLMELRPWARIAATVLDEHDAPVSGAIVAATVRGVAGDAQGKPYAGAGHARSGPDGGAELRVSPDGVYYVAATDGEGMVSPSTLVSVAPGGVSRVELRVGAPTYRLAGRVLHDGVGVSGARIAVSGMGEFLASPFHTKLSSADDGSYSLDLPRPGEYQVTVMATGYVGSVSRVRVGADVRRAHCDLHVHESEPLAGMVLCEGRPLPGVTLEAVPLDAAGLAVDVFRAMDLGSAAGLGMPHRWHMQAETSGSGEFRFASPPPLAGIWRVAISGPLVVGGHVGSVDVVCEPGARSRQDLVVDAVGVQERYPLRVECAANAVGSVKQARFVRGMWGDWKEVQRFSGAHDVWIRGEELGDAFRWDSDDGGGALLSGPQLMRVLREGRLRLAPFAQCVVEVADARAVPLQLMIVRCDFMHIARPMRRVQGGEMVRLVEPPGDYVVTLLEGSNVLDRGVVSLSSRRVEQITLTATKR
jgi:hypothetical protein